MAQLLRKITKSNNPSCMKDQVAIHVASSVKEKEKIYRLRYQIYIEEMGRKISNVDHRRRMLYDDMDDSGVLFYAQVNDEIVGTVRLHIGGVDEFSEELSKPLAMERFHKFRSDKRVSHKLSFASKGMVDPRYRSSQILNLLTIAYYEACREQDVLFNFVGCAPSIVAMHEHLGARRYKSNFYVPHYGCMVPLVNVLQDINHLERVRSPFRFVAPKWPNSSETSEWFRHEFAATSHRYINKQLTNEVEHWQILHEKLGQSPQKAISLFQGFTAEEANQAAYAGHLVYCEAGETIVYPEDRSNEIFIVISGSLSVHKQLASSRQKPVLLTAGQEFGEKTYISRLQQRATVTAQTDSEVLVLPRWGIERLEQKQPAIAAKLMENINDRKYA